MLVTRAPEQVTRLREGRNPAAVLKPGVPADVIAMEVRADHHRHIPWRKAERCEIVQESVRAQVVLPLRGRPLFVVAVAAVHQHHLPAEAQNDALEGHAQLQRVGGDELRPQPVRVAGPVLGGQPLEQEGFRDHQMRDLGKNVDPQGVECKMHGGAFRCPLQAG